MKCTWLLLICACCLLTACSIHEQTDAVYDRDHDTHDIWLEPQECDPAIRRLTCFSIRLRTTPEHQIDILLNESSYRGPDGEVSALRLFRDKKLDVRPEIKMSTMSVFFVPARWYPDSHYPAALPTPLKPIPHFKQTVIIVYTLDGKRLAETYEFDLYWRLQGPAPCMWVC